MAEKNPNLTPAQAETILQNTALDFSSNDPRRICDPFLATPGWSTSSWDTDCGGNACKPLGYGLAQAHAGVNAVP